jgi:predicted metalloprotease
MKSLFKKETLLMCLVLAFYGIIAGGSAESIGTAVIVIIILIVGILAIAGIHDLLTADERKKAAEEREKKRQEHIERLKKEQEEKKQKYNAEKDEILSKYG